MQIFPHQNLDGSIASIFFKRLIDTFDSVYFPSLLEILITIFFSNNAFKKPRVAEQSPQTPTNIGSRYLCPLSFNDFVSIKNLNMLKKSSKIRNLIFRLPYNSFAYAFSSASMFASAASPWMLKNFLFLLFSFICK